MSQERVIRIGQDGGDIVGSDHRALQTAVNECSRQGGGTVEIGPGVYLMNDSVHLRSRVHLRGAGEQTVLRKGPMVESALSADLGYGHYDVSLAEPEKFETGMGIHIADDNAGGFYTTCATLTWRDGDRFGTSRMMNHDYSRARNAIVRSVFPVISGYDLEDVAIQDLAIDGNRSENGHLNGCRGGGIFFSQASRMTIRRVLVHDYNGDGISFQQTQDVLIEDCTCRDNNGHGLHPGSGSVRPVMRRVHCCNNGVDGIFYCLRVSFSLAEECVIENNGHDGISIGGRDTDHHLRANTVRGNERHGLYFRAGDRAMAGHRCLFEGNTLEGNCTGGAEGEICIHGSTMDVQLKNNRIILAGRDCPAIVVGEEAGPIYVEGNRVEPEPEQPVKALGSAEAVIFASPPAPLRVGPANAPGNAGRHLRPEGIE